MFVLQFLLALALTRIAVISATPVGQNLHKSDKLVNLTHLPPSQDPFYHIPHNIGSYRKGSIIRSRLIPTNPQFGDAAGTVYQLFYRTNSVHLKPDATVTTVVAPKQPAKGSPKVVAIATPQDSAAFDCTTSWAIYPNSTSKEASEANVSILEAKAALFNGYYVTIPDLEGSKSAFIAYSEGQAILDGIRAIVNHKDTIPDSKGYRAALTG